LCNRLLHNWPLCRSRRNRRKSFRPANPESQPCVSSPERRNSFSGRLRFKTNGTGSDSEPAQSRFHLQPAVPCQAVSAFSP
jgi:hypothetical protein